MHRKSHFIFGIVLVILFLATGQYMQIVHDRLVNFEGGPRMMIRANHIYILFIALMNLIYSLVPIVKTNRWTFLIQNVISVILYIIPIFIIVGFFTEPFTEDYTRAYTRFGIYLVMAIAVLITIRVFFESYFLKKRENDAE